MADQPILTILDAIRDHLTTHDLPRVLAVSITPRGAVTLQVAHPESLAGLAAELLLWADTLIDVMSSRWRSPFSEAVHLDVLGYLPSGIEVTLFGGVSAGDGFCEDLPPGAKGALSYRVLRDLAGGAA